MRRNVGCAGRPYAGGGGWFALAGALAVFPTPLRGRREDAPPCPCALRVPSGRTDRGEGERGHAGAEATSRSPLRKRGGGAVVVCGWSVAFSFAGRRWVGDRRPGGRSPPLWAVRDAAWASRRRGSASAGEAPAAGKGGSGCPRGTSRRRGSVGVASAYRRSRRGSASVSGAIARMSLLRGTVADLRSPSSGPCLLGRPGAPLRGGWACRAPPVADATAPLYGVEM